VLEFSGQAVNDLSLGATVDVDAFTGACTLSVPIETPEARDDMSPSLSLGYSSGGGNSPYGAGWSLSGLASVGIDTRYHVPRWDGTDGFQFGNDELVPWLEKTGAGWTPRGFLAGDWSVALYRSRRGSAKTRVEKWVHVLTGRVHFRTRDAGNCVTIYGARPNAAGRIADPADEARTYDWLPELVLDPNGNAIWIEYASETVDGIDRTASYERLRPSLAQRYPKRISYGNTAPLTLDDALVSGQLPAGTQWCFHVVADYGDHSDPVAPGPIPDRSWPVRRDPFSIYSCGFDVRTYRLCRRFLTFHTFGELGSSPKLVRSLVLTHDEHPAGSTLTQIQSIGYRHDGGTTTSAALPALTMAYAQAEIDTAFSEVSQQSTANAPAGLAVNRYSFVDLYGEGLPGILFQDEQSWYYKPNQGDSTFGPQTVVATSPAVGANTFVCGDLDANGNTEFALLGGRNAGSFELDRETETWSAFRSFAAFPHVEAMGADTRWVDLNGDRRPDVVVTKDDHFTWFASDGDEFASPVDVPRPRGIDDIPTLVDDTDLDFIFADMTGDGLADLVRVRPGCVVYWPSLGNGYFGEAVVMEGAPQFSADGEFDASRIRVTDLDGSGTTDIVYLGHGQVSCWINASGNQLLPGPLLGGLPYFDNVSTIGVLDFLGDGRPCLVWSSPLPGRESALEYLRLAPAVRPRLLLQVDDSMGRITTLTYTSSATHYLRDLQSGRGWTTRLPGHRPVVERREIVDQISGTGSVRRLEYHDGFYDGDERELRGFGQVDIYDSDLADQPGPTTAAVAPPALERRWYHLGAAVWELDTSERFYAGDPHLPVLAPHEIDDAVGLSTDEIDEGLRALAGSFLRREMYAVDSTGIAAADPLEVTQVGYRLRVLQPAGGAERPAFSKIVRENATWVYEQVAGDPRIVHELVIDTDEFDQPVRDLLIGYARRTTTPPDIDDQSRYHLRVRDTVRIAFDDAQRYEVGIPVEARSYELAGVRPVQEMFTRAQFVDPLVVAALTTPGRHDIDPPDNPIQGPRARLLSWEQTFFWDDTQTAPMPLGQASAPLLLHHEEAACFEPAFVTDLYGTRVDNALLGSLGYALRDGFWWQSDEVHSYLAAAQFRRISSLRRGDGAETHLGYDAYALVHTVYTDALDNALTAEIDYHTLAPWRITDANGSVNEVRYDPLGVIVLSTTYGTIGPQAWGFDPLSAVLLKTPAGVADAVATASSLVQGAMRYVWYDLHAWKNSGSPTTLVTLSRESLKHDGHGGGTAGGVVEIVVSYFDAMGRLLQEKKLVEAGPAITRDTSNQVRVDVQGQPITAPADPRWRSSGHIAYDAKERPARQFEPFFTATPAYEGDAVLRSFGTSTLLRYDVLGRTVGQEFANGTFTRTLYKPWSIEIYDANDTVLDSAYGASHQSLPPGDPELQAYQNAVPHANTINIEYLDPLARSSGRLAQGGATAPDRFTQSHRDLHGSEKDMVDPRGLTAFGVRFDMQNRPLYQSSIDAGEVWQLPDAYGRDTNIWDSRGFAIVHGYDVDDRLLFTEVKGGDGTAPLDNRVEEWVYGESLANRADAIARNLLGHVAITRDGAQEMTVGQCDPTGRVSSISRRLRVDVDTEPDWRVAVALEPDTFVESVMVDGLGRALTETLADGTVRTYSYALSGILTQVLVTTPDGSVTTVPVLDGATVNARGQRVTQGYGNGTVLNFSYDPQTYRLATQSARRGGSIFQQIGYTYDPVGNIVRVTDAAQEGSGALVSGLSVPARRDYVYDAHYRLRQATGRVHQALQQNDFVPGAPGTVKGTRHISLNNGAAIERFTRTYDFDVAGNLLSLKHASASQSWTTAMWVSATSNRSMPALDLSGNPVSTPEARYDGAGNQATLEHLRALEWNWRNNLARAVVIVRPGGTDDDERYVYGADALRVRKVTTRVIGSGGTERTETVYFHDVERKRIIRGGSIILERWSVHVSDGEWRVAIVNRWTTDTTAREVDDTSKAQIRYQLTTHQASVAIELDESASLISYEEYFPYGGTSFIAGDKLREIDTKDYRYSGKECDDFTGLYAYGYRYYAPWMARWLSPDPSGPEDDLNLYQFALGDPVHNVDPDGLDSGDSEKEDRPHIVAVASNRLSATNHMLVQAREWYQGLSPHDKSLMNSSKYVMIPRNMDDPGAGAMVVTKQEYQRKYLPAQLEWAKKHGIKNLNIVIPKTGPPPPEVTDEDKDGGTGTSTDGTPGLSSDDPSTSAKEESGGGTGTATAGGDGHDKTSTDGGGGTGKTADAGDGSGAAGTNSPGAVDHGDGAGTTPGTSREGAGHGAGAGAGTSAGNSKTQGSGGSGGGTGTDKGIGSSRTRMGTGPGGVASDFGEPGGRADGVLGGTPYSPGGSIDNLGNAYSPRAPSNGSSKDGQITQTRRQSGHGSGTEGNDPKSGGRDAGKSGKSPNQDGVHGPGGPPGSSSKTGTPTGTTASQPNSNSNATGHGTGAGGGKHPTGETGVTADLLKVAGALNLEFGDDDPNGAVGGIPGGRGWLKGKFWQYLYIAVTVIDTIFLVKSIIKSIAKGALSRLWRLIRSPRAILRDVLALGREIGGAWRTFFRRSGGIGPGKRAWQFVTRFFWDARKWKSIQSARNGSTLLKPRLFGTLERVGKKSLYTWEHIIPQSVGRKFPRLAPFINSYANTFLRLPMEFNSALGNRVWPKLQFYIGAGSALRRSWQLGTWMGEKAIEDDSHATKPPHR
jgi:RHS repeat-associated protein